MKVLKIILIFLLAITFTNSLNAQEVVKKKSKREKRRARKAARKKEKNVIQYSTQTKNTVVDAYTKSQTAENQKKTVCKLFHLILQNATNKYAYLTGNEIVNNGFFKHYYYKKQMPNRFIKHYIDKKYGVFNLTVYDGYQLEKANSEFNKLANDWKKCINETKTAIFVSEKNNLEAITGKRKMIYTTLNDRIIASFKINKTIDFKNNKKRKYHVNVSFIKIKDKK